MSLDFQNVDVKFNQGLDTRTEKKLVIPGKWNQLKNCSLAANDTPQRRDGSVALVASATGNSLAAFNDELLVISGPTASSVTQSPTSTVQSRSGLVGNVVVGKTEIHHDEGSQCHFDMAHGGGLTCCVWVDAQFAVGTSTRTGVKCSLYDETTGTQYLTNFDIKVAATAVFPRVVYSPAASGSAEAFMIFYIHGAGAGTSLGCRVIQTFAPTTVGAEVNLIVSADLSFASFYPFDAIHFEVSGVAKGAMVTYVWNDGTTAVRTVHVSHSASVPSIDLGPLNLITEAEATTVLAVTSVRLTATLAATFVYTSGGTKTGMNGITSSANFIVVTAATNLSATAPNPLLVYPNHITAVHWASGSTSVFWDFQNVYNNITTIVPILTITVSDVLAIIAGPSTFTNSLSSTAAAGNAAPPNGPFICGKAFASGSSVYLPTCVMERYDTLPVDVVTLNQQSTFFLFQATGATHAVAVVVSRALAGSFGYPYVGAVGGNLSPELAMACSTPAIGSGFGILLPESVDLILEGSLNVSPSGVCRLDLTPNSSLPVSGRQLGESVYMAGGNMTSYDGKEVVETGFPLFPEGISVTAVGGAGDVTPGTHQVVAVYEWTDNNGVRWQSSPSKPVSVTTVAADFVRVKIPNLVMSQKTGISLVPYMTDAAGTVFKRAISVSNPIFNNTSSFSTTVDVGVNATWGSASDAHLDGTEPLYTQPDQSGTTLPTKAPPPFSVMAVHQNRLFFDIADKRDMFGYSQQWIAGSPLLFSSALSIQLPTSNGGVAGFSSMDEKLIILCGKKIFVLYGSGPDVSGSNSGYGQPQEIPSDVGCSESTSILSMPNGIIFKSIKGWYMLGRDLVCRYIGAGVENLNTNTVSSAVLLQDRQECRFTSTSGTQLIYAYDLNGGQWSTTEYRADSGAAVTNVAVADAVYWSTIGAYVTVSTVHGLNKDTPGIFLDKPGTSPNALAIITTARTSWLKMSVINGFQRVRKLYLTGTTATAPTSTLAVAVDFDDGYGQVSPGSYSFSVNFGTMFTTFTTGITVDFRHAMQQQKCKSVAFTFVDTPLLASPAGGVNYQDLSLELGLKKGLKKLPAAQSS